MARKRPNISISFDPDLFEAIEKVVKKTKVSKSGLIGRILRKDPEIRVALRGEESNRKIARTCHQLWVARQEVTGFDPDPPWEKLTKRDKETSVWGVEYVLSHSDITPEELFFAWRKHKVENGWSFGEMRDKMNKTHPYIIEEFEKLPEEEKLNYRLFIKTVQILS